MFIMFIYNSQKLERSQMSFNRGMNTENVVHLHNGVITQLLETMTFMKFLGKCMELETIFHPE